MRDAKYRTQNEANAIASNLILIVHSAFIVPHSPSCHNTDMGEQMLQRAIAEVPAGRWAVGVSGGADSVALLLVLAERSDLSLHVVHLDHETRSGASAADAGFVMELAARLKLPCRVEKRSVIEAAISSLEKNTSSRYRQARFELFSRVVNAEQLQGVLLAHHADDQAESVLMRLLRGAAAANLRGICGESLVGGLRIVRPLLQVPGQALRDFLRQRNQPWREDASNQSDEYQRNRLRRWLVERPTVRNSLLRLEAATSAVHHWLEVNAPNLGSTFSAEELGDLPLPLARHAAARWLVRHGAPPEQVSSQTCQRLIDMCSDAAAPPRQHFPGGLLVLRRKAKLFAQPPRD
jgi:tRNA(Ile)-lysidine synthetase-like protein